MPVPRGTIYIVKTYESGKRVRSAISPSGKIIETKRLKSTRTRTGKRLAKRRRRISR